MFYDLPQVLPVRFSSLWSSIYIIYSVQLLSNEKLILHVLQVTQLSAFSDFTRRHAGLAEPDWLVIGGTIRHSLVFVCRDIYFVGPLINPQILKKTPTRGPVGPLPKS